MSKEKIVGVIKATEPLIINNEHVKYEKYFKHYLTIDDKKGVVLSESNKYPYPVGSKVSCEAEPPNEKRKNWKYTGVKLLEDKGGTKGYNNPELVVTISHGMCQSIAIDMCINGGKFPDSIAKVNGYADIFFKWVMADGVNRDTCSRRYYSLQDAVKLMKCENGFVKTKDDILETATALFNHNKEIAESYEEKEKEETTATDPF